MPLIEIAVLALILASFGAGFWVASHIHSVVNAATRAVTIPDSVQKQLDAASPPVGAAVDYVAKATKSTINKAASKVSQ